MAKISTQALLEKFADLYGWRCLTGTHEILGIHQGVGCHLIESHGELFFLFFAPSANIGDEILQYFAGFHHFAGAGLPVSWLLGRTEDDNSCTLRLDADQIAAIGVERLMDIPAIIANDFHAHGAAEPLTCPHCKQYPATEVMAVGTLLQFSCAECRQLTQIQAPGGELNRGGPIPWRDLAAACGIGCVLWAAIFHLAVLNYAMPPRDLYCLPFGLGALAPYFILRSQPRVNWTLYLTACLAMTVAVLAGNLWGFCVMIRQAIPDMPWEDVFASFFLRFLLASENLTAIVSGCLGIIVGIAWRKKPVQRLR